MPHTAYYDFLGVSPDATDKEIRRAYRRLAMKYHPDKCGDVDQFKQLQTVNEVLSDPKRRKIYDERGEAGLLEAGSRGAANKVRVVRHDLLCELEELYIGTPKTLLLSKTCVCPSCNGKGVMEPTESFACATCNGEKKFVRTVHLGPFAQNLEQVCPVCQGAGVQLRATRRCELCKGKKVTDIQQTLDLYLERGMEKGHRIIFREVGDQSPGSIPGDIIITIHERRHPIFHREGSMLVAGKTITLKEALCGFTFDLTHLDGRVLKITSKPGQDVIKPGDVRVIKDEGMPVYKNPFEKGDLFIKFQVKFPKRQFCSEDQLATLSSVLPEEPELADDLKWEPKKKRKRQHKEEPESRQVVLSEVDPERLRRKQEERMLRQKRNDFTEDSDYDSLVGTTCANQ